MDRTVSEVAELRGLDEITPVRTEVLDQAALDAFVEAQFEKETPADELAAQEGLFERLGFLEPGAGLRALYVDLLTSQVLGFYDTEDETFRVVARSDGIGGLEKVTMSHELTHALQDQHFDLDKLLPPDLKEESDLVLARQALAEGDATLLMTQWTIGHLSPDELLEVVAAASDPEQQAILARTPAILAEPLQFPYVQGLAFVSAAWSDSGWAAVDRLYADPPDSTEQVLHPDKFAAREEPDEVALPADLAARMGSGWSVDTSDTFGEYVVSLWLREAGSGVASADADAAAAGWGGDRLAYLAGPGGADAVVWRTTWDSASDADQFAGAAGTLIGDGIGDEPAAGTVVRVSATEVTVLLASDGATLDAATAAAGLGSPG